MAKIHMVDQLVSAFLELNPSATQAQARSLVKQIDRGMQPAVLAEWKAQAKLRADGQQALPLDQPRKGVRNAPESPVTPRKEVKKPYTLLLPPSMLEALTERSNADGASVSHHIRAAIAAYLRGGRR